MLLGFRLVDAGPQTARLTRQTSGLTAIASIVSTKMAAEGRRRPDRTASDTPILYGRRPFRLVRPKSAVICWPGFMDDVPGGHLPFAISG